GIEDVVRRAAEGERDEGAPQLHQRQAGGDRSQVRAAVLFGCVDAPEAEVARLCPQVAQTFTRQPRLPLALVAQDITLKRHQLAAHELTHSLLDQFLFGSQSEVHSEPPRRWQTYSLLLMAGEKRRLISRIGTEAVPF